MHETVSIRNKKELIRDKGMERYKDKRDKRETKKVQKREKRR
jgi:hypothetical protein